MHMTIGVIVYAPNEGNAIDIAKDVFNYLVENQYFDYFTCIDKDGKEREIAYNADSTIGSQQIADLMLWQKRDFMKSLKEIRRIIESHDDEMIWNEEANPFEPSGSYNFRYEAYCVGQYHGSYVRLYNDENEGIRTEEQLRNVLARYKCIYEDKGEPNPHLKDDVWIVLADVHY